MTATSRYTGKNLHVVFRTSAGVEYTLHGDQTRLEVTEEVQSADMTAGSDTGVYEKPTLQVMGATLTVKHTGASGTAVWVGVDIGDEGTLIYGPAGTAAGAPKGGFPCYVRSRSLDVPYNEAVVRTATFGPQGARLYDVETDVWP
ncbi:MAG: hypothetical protein JW910_05360 [Anaerolineae bacterium]|nr:hypothetical protein [Anaerolineae bacterium]